MSESDVCRCQILPYKVGPHTERVNSPVCIRLCDIRCDWYLVLNPQLSQRYGRDSLCVTLCCCRVPLVANVRLQSVHTKGLSPAKKNKTAIHINHKF